MGTSCNVTTGRTRARRRIPTHALALGLAAACLLAMPSDAAAQRHGGHRGGPPARVVVAPGLAYGGWYGPYPGWYGPVYGPAYGPYREESGVRLKLRPRDASVFVDGYYAGIVDDFDGVFQYLALRPGGHHIEIKMPGYQTAAVDLHIQPGRRMTYRTDLQPDRP